MLRGEKSKIRRRIELYNASGRSYRTLHLATFVQPSYQIKPAFNDSESVNWSPA